MKTDEDDGDVGVDMNMVIDHRSHLLFDDGVSAGEI